MTLDSAAAGSMGESPEPLPRIHGVAPAWLLLATAIVLVAIDFAWPMVPGLSPLLLALLSGLAAPWGWLVLKSAAAEGAAPDQSKMWLFRLAILALALGALGAKWWLLLGTPAEDGVRYVGSSRSYAVALLLIYALGLAGAGLRFAKFMALVADHPARAIALSFGTAGLLGGFLLSLPVSLQRVHELSMLDNLFTAFSAVCVTGLTVNHVPDTYTRTGQAVICLLIQVGGIGIMVLSAAIALLTGKSMRIRSSAVLAEIVDAESLSQLRRLVIAIVVSTLSIEALATLILLAELWIHPEVSGGGGALFTAVFHAVSAFCNAGFSNLDRGLLPFTGNSGIMAVITVLIVAGGIGFPVLHELAFRLGRRLQRRRQQRMTLHSRISLAATLILLGAVAVGYLLLEWHGTLARFSGVDRVMAALFHAASSRTAGFSIIDLAVLQPATQMLTMVAMFIGACPGSCGGGVKTTTVAVLFAALRSELQGSPAYLLDRALPASTVRKAIGVSFLSLGIVLLALFLLLLVEDQPPVELAFEVFSAFSTTGLSTGVTPRLSAPGKFLLLLTMFIGRIGPLTLALAVSGRAEPRHLQLPGERVLIG